MGNRFDVAIIGAGTAGLTARAEVSKRTENYVVIDGGTLGTTCASVGCMPSKALIEIANAAHKQVLLRNFGISDMDLPHPDNAKVMSHVRRLRDRFVDGVIKDMDRWKKHLIRKNARFIDANTLDLGDERLLADRIIIATGSKSVMPERWSRYRRYLLFSEDFFELESLPRRIAIFGLGPNGIELGQALTQLGIEVFAISKNKALGGLTDPDVQEYAFQTFSKKMSIEIGSGEILGESDGELSVACNDKSWTVDRVLLAIGRQPAVEGLGLENLGVPLDGRGMPRVDEGTLQIENLPIFMAGDANGIRPLLHEASDEGRIAGHNAASSESACFERRVPLQIVFSNPNIAVVGQSFASLMESEADFVIGESNYEHLGRAIMMDCNEGMFRLYAGKHDGYILGAELIAPHGEHLAHLINWSIGSQLHAADVLSMPLYHPVLEEGLRKAFRDAARESAAIKPQHEMLRCEDAIVG
jgi:dihydrolipoamide dehydrogenase